MLDRTFPLGTNRRDSAGSSASLKKSFQKNKTTSTPTTRMHHHRRSSLDFLKKTVRFADDETSICSSSASTLVPTPLPPVETERGNVMQHSSTPVSPILSGQGANKFLEEVQSVVYEQQNRIGALNQSIYKQKGIAKGRYIHGNITGACLAMKKVKRIERERNLTLSAMDLAMEAAVEIKVAMHKAATATTSKIAGRPSSLSCCYRVNIGSHGRVLARVQHIMLEKETALPLGRKQLVKLVEELL